MKKTDTEILRKTEYHWRRDYEEEPRSQNTGQRR
jgi:hypothetical protein